MKNWSSIEVIRIYRPKTRHYDIEMVGFLRLSFKWSFLLFNWCHYCVFQSQVQIRPKTNKSRKVSKYIYTLGAINTWLIILYRYTYLWYAGRRVCNRLSKTGTGCYNLAKVQVETYRLSWVWTCTYWNDETIHETRKH